jgi:hypothetical protein
MLPAASYCSGMDEYSTDYDKHDEQHYAKAEAPGDQLFLDWQKRLGVHLAHFVSELRLLLLLHCIPLLAYERRLHAGEE